MSHQQKRTQIVIDAELVEQGLQITGLKSRGELVDFALRELLRRENQKKLLNLKGQVEWKGDSTTLTEEQRQRAIKTAGRFASGTADIAARHDDYLADAFDS